jgi:hypothetical protein
MASKTRLNTFPLIRPEHRKRATNAVDRQDGPGSPLADRDRGDHVTGLDYAFPGNGWIRLRFQCGYALPAVIRIILPGCHVFAIGQIQHFCLRDLL